MVAYGISVPPAFTWPEVVGVMRCYDGKQCSSGVAKLGVFWVRSEYVAGAF